MLKCQQYLLAALTQELRVLKQEHFIFQHFTIYEHLKFLVKLVQREKRFKTSGSGFIQSVHSQPDS